MTHKEVREPVSIQQYKLAWHRKAIHNLRAENLALRAALEDIVKHPEMAQIIAQVHLTTIPQH